MRLTLTVCMQQQQQQIVVNYMAPFVITLLSLRSDACSGRSRRVEGAAFGATAGRAGRRRPAKRGDRATGGVVAPRRWRTGGTEVADRATAGELSLSTKRAYNLCLISCERATHDAGVALTAGFRRHRGIGVGSGGGGDSGLARSRSGPRCAADTSARRLSPTKL